MIKEYIYLIIFFVILILLLLLNFGPNVSNTLGLTPNQKAFLFSSSLFCLLFFGYFAKALIIDKNIPIMQFVALYPLWYYLTKLTVNKITNQNDYINDI